MRYTYYEDGYWAVITLPNGHTYYKGTYNCRSTAYRVAKRENRKHAWANQNGMIYNTRQGQL